MEIDKIAIGKLIISRLVAGTNQISGFSHFSKQLDQEMIDYFGVNEVMNYFNQCINNGITTVVARADAFMSRMIYEYRRTMNQHIVWIAQTAKEYYDIFENIRYAYKNRCDAIYIHGGTIDRYCEQDRAPELVHIIEKAKKEFNMPVGIAAHDPENHKLLASMTDQIDFHLVCMYNISGYRDPKSGNVYKENFNWADRNNALNLLSLLNKPCLLYKIFAAGRLSKDQAFEDIRRSIRKCDGVLIGMYPKDNPNIFTDNTEMMKTLW